MPGIDVTSRAEDGMPLPPYPEQTWANQPVHSLGVVLDAVLIGEVQRRHTHHVHRPAGKKKKQR